MGLLMPSCTSPWRPARSTRPWRQRGDPDIGRRRWTLISPWLFCSLHVPSQKNSFRPISARSTAKNRLQWGSMQARLSGPAQHMRTRRRGVTPAPALPLLPPRSWQHRGNNHSNPCPTQSLTSQRCFSTSLKQVFFFRCRLLHGHTYLV